MCSELQTDRGSSMSAGQGGRVVSDRVASPKELEDGVRSSLPELSKIQDAELREKVVKAHVLALSQSEFRRIEDMPPSGIPGSPLMKRGTQADHYRAVAAMALAMADSFEDVIGSIGIDRDILVAS